MADDTQQPDGMQPPAMTPPSGPGFLGSLGGGMQAAGAILSPMVYKTQAIERENALTNILTGLKISKEKMTMDADQKVTEALKSSGLQPGMASQSMIDALSKVPPELRAISPIYQQAVQQVYKQSEMEKSQAAQIIQAQDHMMKIQDFINKKNNPISTHFDSKTGMVSNVFPGGITKTTKFAEPRDDAPDPFMKEGARLDKLVADGQGNSPEAIRLRKHLDKMDAPARTTVQVGGVGSSASPLGNDPNFWYEYYDKTKTLPPMAWGAAGNPTREAFLKGFPEWKKSQGGTAIDTAVSQSQYKSNAAALTNVSKDLNTFEPYKKMLDVNADIAIQLGNKISQTNAAFVNKPLNWLRQNASSNPDVSEYLAQIKFVQTEAARVINNPRIVGQLTDDARKEMETVINGNAPIEVVDRVLKRLKIDGNNRFNAMRGQQAQLMDEMRGNKPKIEQPPAPATKTSAPAAAIEYLKSHPDQKDAFKSKYGYIPEGM